MSQKFLNSAFFLSASALLFNLPYQAYLRNAMDCGILFGPLVAGLLMDHGGMLHAFAICGGLTAATSAVWAAVGINVEGLAPVARSGSGDPSMPLRVTVDGKEDNLN